MDLKDLIDKALSLGRWAGLDRAIFYTILGRGWSVLVGPITVLVVARFLSPEEQGFYYTFWSILGLQVFFELGLAFVIMQSVSHEKAHLEWTAEGTLEGDPRAKARLASIFRLSLRWYFIIALLAFVTLTIAGLVFFRAYQPIHSEIEWRVPWVLLAGFTALSLVLTPFYGLLQGCGKVAEVAQLVVIQSIVGSLVVWGTILADLKLYAAPAMVMVTSVIGIAYLSQKCWRTLFRDLLFVPIPNGSEVSWRKEILPFQWKISLSWLSGYFIFQLANPVMFRFHGAAEAGRMGMTMRIVESIMFLGVSWVSTKSAPFGNYIAKRDFATLDHIFWKAFWQSLGVVVLGGVAFMGGYYVLRAGGVTLLQRLLDPIAIWLLLGNALINCAVFNQATYLRAHKQEPFLINSLIGAVVVPAIMYFLGRPYGATGIAAGLFCGGLLLGLPLATAVFIRKKREWHQT